MKDDQFNTLMERLQLLIDANITLIEINAEILKNVVIDPELRKENRK